MAGQNPIGILAKNNIRKGFGISTLSSEKNAKISVLLVDDHPMVLQGLTQSLSETGQIELVGTSENGMDAIQKFRALHSDIILLDLTLPDMAGLQVLKLLQCELGKSRVIIYTMHNNKEYVQECLSLGACGYVLKSSSPKDIIEAIEGAMQGQIVLDATILKSLTVQDTILQIVKKQAGKNSVGEMLKTIKSSVLTKKETQILQLIANGSTMHQIAQTLGVSYNTMTVHCKHIYKKLDVHNGRSAVAKALKEHIISL